jgi:hypothetical protein
MLPQHIVFCDLLKGDPVYLSFLSFELKQKKKWIFFLPKNGCFQLIYNSNRSNLEIKTKVTTNIIPNGEEQVSQNCMVRLESEHPG